MVQSSADPELLDRGHHRLLQLRLAPPLEPHQLRRLLPAPLRAVLLLPPGLLHVLGAGLHVAFQVSVGKTAVPVAALNACPP